MEKDIIKYFRGLLLFTSVMMTIGLWITGFEAETIARVFPLYVMMMVSETISFFTTK
jgi:hypothetical protein